MRRAWVIRGGDDNRSVDAFVAAGVIGVGYPDVPDGRTVDRWDVTELLRLKGWTSPEGRAEAFELFVRSIGVGDVVVMPDTPRREVVMGRIEGDYEFVAHLPPDDHRHRRPVSWFGRHRVDLLPGGVRDLSKQRNVLTERTSVALVDHAAAVERGELGRDPMDTASQARTPPIRSTKPRVTGKAATSKVAAPKAATPAPTVRSCPACYLVKNVTLFREGSDVCVDCA